MKPTNQTMNGTHHHHDDTKHGGGGEGYESCASSTASTTTVTVHSDHSVCDNDTIIDDDHHSALNFCYKQLEDHIAWDAHYEQLLVYRYQHGHVNIITAQSSSSSSLLDNSNRKLHAWCVENRRQHAARTLSLERVQKLERIGFFWNAPVLGLWERQLQRYQDVSSSPATRGRTVPSEIAAWVKHQRYRYRKNIIKASEVARLDSIGFDWGNDKNWMKHYNALVPEHSNLPNKKNRTKPTKKKAQPKYNNDLRRWMEEQRTRRTKGTLRDHQQQQLNAIHFSWAMEQPTRKTTTTTKGQKRKRTPPKQTAEGQSFVEECDPFDYEHCPLEGVLSWDDMLEQLRHYKLLHGTVSVGRNSNQQYEKTLHDWAELQRKSYREGYLSNYQRAQLESLGFVWNPASTSVDNDNHQVFGELYHRLKLYKDLYGDCNVPKNFEDDPDLAGWVQAIRKSCTREDWIGKLDALGFEWQRDEARKNRIVSAANAAWDKSYAKLVEFVQQQGHCNVSSYSEIDGGAANLVEWIEQQRTLYRAGDLSVERRAKLERIQFPFDVVDNTEKESVWEGMFAKLQAYQASHGDCNVPKYYAADIQLGSWVGRNRHLAQTGQLSMNKKAKLDGIGFDWDHSDAPDAWWQQYHRICAFQERHGHCNVPIDSAEDPGLANWVKCQRQREKYNMIQPEQRDLLDAIQFQWTRRRDVGTAASTKDWEKQDDQEFGTVVASNGCGANSSSSALPAAASPSARQEHTVTKRSKNNKTVSVGEVLLEELGPVSIPLKLSNGLSLMEDGRPDLRHIKHTTV